MKNTLKTNKQKNTLKAILLLLGCLAFLPEMQAVNPPPDGCYPNNNTAEGCNALQSLTTGTGNAALGSFSLLLTSGGSLNTAIGFGTLPLNNADQNTAVGAAALLLNTAGTGNSAFGFGALVTNDSGSSNTAVGSGALGNSTGDSNTAVGVDAGSDPGITSNNIYIGDTGFTDDVNVIAIGALSATGTDYTSAFIGGVYGAGITTGDALPVFIGSDGHLGTSAGPVNGSAKGLRMRGSHGAARPQASINEFQKQQKRIAELENTVARLVATVKEQAAQIEKVSAQLELQKPAQRVVTNKE
jgi:hypothetical protein